jgi:2-alkyl-3-oxoalkanoate reductase
MPGRITVIGATGYLGQAVVPRCTAAGHPVCMIARHPPPAAQPGTEFVACDATDGRALSRALEGCPIVVNLAAGRPAAMESIAEHLKTALRLQRIARLIHVSSLAVFGAPAGVFDEASAPCPHHSHTYAVAKARAEKLLEPQLEAGRCVIVRPGCIYGPSAPVWTNSIGRLLLCGRLGNLGPAGTGIAPLIHVSDVADAVVTACLAPAGIYHVLGDETISWNEYFGRFANALGIGALPRISGPRMEMETWLRGPATKLCAHIGGRWPDIISPAMRRLFATRASVIARRAICPSTLGSNRLQDALVEAAIIIHHHATGRRLRHVSTQTVNFT